MLVNIKRISRETIVAFMDKENSSLREYGGFFEAKKSTLLTGLISARKYMVFSMICSNGMKAFSSYQFFCQLEFFSTIVWIKYDVVSFT